MNNAVSYDVIIVGGGFAGLTAAHWLGRFHRRTLVLTSGPSRNARSHAVHGYPGYEGADPSKLLDTMRREALAVDTELRQEGVTAATGTAGDFTVTTATASYRAKRLLIATGVRDESPRYRISIYMMG